MTAATSGELMVPSSMRLRQARAPVLAVRAAAHEFHGVGQVAGGAKADSRALFHNESVAKVEHDGFYLVEDGLVEVTTVDAFL